VQLPVQRVNEECDRQLDTQTVENYKAENPTTKRCNHAKKNTSFIIGKTNKKNDEKRPFDTETYNFVRLVKAESSFGMVPINLLY